MLELPWTGTGYGTQVTLPFSGLNEPSLVAVDSAGDLFVVDYGNNDAVELPKTATGYEPQVTLPFSGLSSLRGIAVDGGKDVFLVDSFNDRVLELPWTGTSYGPQATLPTNGLTDPWGVALDSGGDVFIADWANHRVVELPKTATGYGPQTTLAFSGLSTVGGDAVDNAGNVFVADWQNNDREVELQTISVNFEGVNVCAPGQTTPAPCSETLTLNYNVTAGGTLGTPKVLTGGAPDLDFTLASGSTCTGTVTEGATCTVNVTFAPLATATRNGSVEITDGSGTVLATTPISGYGAQIQFSPSPLDFGTIPFGSTSTLPLTVTNIGPSTLTVAPSIRGPSYKIISSTCGAGVTAGNSCTLEVEFDPIVVSVDHHTLTITTSAGAATFVALTGTASGVGPEIETPLQFGTISVGETEVLPLTIFNLGVPGTVTITTKIDGPSYKILTTAQNTCMAGVATDQSCTLPVEFDPGTVAVDHHTLTITPAGGLGISTVRLYGTAD